MSRSKFIFMLSIVLLLFSAVSFAYTLEVGIPGQAAPESDINFVQYLEMIYRFAMWGVGLAAFVMLIWAGMQWIVSGLPDAKADAMEQIKAALIGLGLVLLSVLILQTINKDFTNSTLPDPNQIPRGTPTATESRPNQYACVDRASGNMVGSMTQTSISCTGTQDLMVYTWRSVDGCYIPLGGNTCANTVVVPNSTAPLTAAPGTWSCPAPFQVFRTEQDCRGICPNQGALCRENR